MGSDLEACHDIAFSTSFDSSSFPIRPKLRIDPAFGAFSLGCAASAFRYAFCIALARAAYSEQAPSEPVSIDRNVGFLRYLFPVM